MIFSGALSAAAWTQFWQLSAVIVAVGAVTALCRLRRPHLAYALWMVVLAKAVTPPIWSSNLSALAHVREPAPPSWLAGDAEIVAQTKAQIEKRAPIAESPHVVSQTPRPTTARTMYRPIWLVLWFAGAFVVVACAAVMRGRRNHLLASAVPGDEALTSLVAQLARQLGVAPPAVVVSDEGLGPAVCGMRRPLLTPPTSIAAAEVDLRPIVAHELIHLRRGDHIVVAVQFLIQAVWWFHPLVWWANRRICRARESCCDVETVAALGEPPQRYARALVDVLDAKRRVRPVFGFPGVRPVEVTAARVKEIFTMSDRFLSRTPMSYWFAALVTAALVLPGGALNSVSPQAADAAPPPDAAKAKGEAAPAAAADATETETKPKKPLLLLKYGDGKPDGKQSLGGSGEMIRFTMPKGQTNALKGLRLHGARYGYPQPPKEEVEINILSKDMKEVLHTELVPYSLFKRQPEPRWMAIPFEDPVDVPETFWVVLNFNAEATKGVYVSYDTSTKGKYSRAGFNDQDATETKNKADWMVQAMLAK